MRKNKNLIPEKHLRQQDVENNSCTLKQSESRARQKSEAEASGDQVRTIQDSENQVPFEHEFWFE